MSDVDTNLDENQLYDYRDNLKEGSESGDAAYFADTDSSGPNVALTEHGAIYDLLRVKARELDTSYAMGRVEYFRGKIDEYFTHGVRATKTRWSYGSMVKQRDGHIKDVNAIQQANVELNLFAPTSDLAGRAMVRVETMQELLPEIATEDADFDAELKGHTGKLAKQAKHTGMASSRGLVTNARNTYQQARNDVKTAALDFTEIVNGEVMQALVEKLNDKRDQKEEIERKIARIRKATGYISKGIALVGAAASAGAGYMPTVTTVVDEGFASEDPFLNAASKASDHTDHGEGVVDAVLELAYGKDLDILEHQMQSLQDEMSTWTEVSKENQLQKKIDDFKNAKEKYVQSYKAYMDAVANQRANYMTAAADTDAAEAKKRKKDAPKDPVSQIMLYISTVREAYVFMQDALSAYNGGAEAKLLTAMKSMQSHQQEWQEVPHGPRQAVMAEQRPDYSELRDVLSQFLYFKKWAPHELVTLEKLENSARHAMSGVKVSGDY